MQIISFADGGPQRLEGPMRDEDKSKGLFWLDIERPEPNWYDQAKPWLGALLHERHIQDSLNEIHPPFYDGTSEYDLLLVRALCPDCPPEAPITRAIAFIVTANVVVSVRPPQDPTFDKLRQRFLSNPRKYPESSTMLLYLLLDQIADVLLERREVTSDLLTRWQERLLDRNDVFDDWQALMRLRGHLRRLEVLFDNQMVALAEWREQTTLKLENSLMVRFNDLQEHLRRIYNHSTVVQHDIESLVQIYFSASTQRTNETLQFLAIVSAIFLPLNLLAGLFGMNFDNMPLLEAPYGPWMVAGFMLTLATGFLIWFRRRRWI